MSSDSAQENISEPTEEQVTAAAEVPLAEQGASDAIEPESGEASAPIFAPEPLSEQRIENIIEAALMAAGQPLSIDRMLTLFMDNNQPSRDEVRAALAKLAEACEMRGIELVEVGSGFRYQAKQENAEWVARLWEEKPARYSRALLETLALIAYRQPITRGEIEDIRGVSVSTNIMKTLMERDWVKVVGHRDVPGKPAMYASTKQFLDYFSLKGLNDLPSLAEIRDIDSINAELDLAEPDADKKSSAAEAQLDLAANEVVEVESEDEAASLAGDAAADESLDSEAGDEAQLEASSEANAEDGVGEGAEDDGERLSTESPIAEHIVSEKSEASTADPA